MIRPSGAFRRRKGSSTGGSAAAPGDQFNRPSTLSLNDLMTEALAGILQRPGRSFLTMLGTVLGLGGFIAVLGLTATAGGHVSQRFDMLAATEVSVRDVGTGDPLDTEISFREDATARVSALNGVVRAGVWWTAPLRDPSISSHPVQLDDGTSPGSGLSLYAAEPSALAAMRPGLQSGRLYDSFHQSRKERVAVLGRLAADRLGIQRLDTQPAVFVNGTPYTVVGVIESLARESEMLLSVIIPTSTALQLYGPPVEARAKMIIETRVGAAGLIASQAPIALRPDSPTRFKVDAPADPELLRREVSGDLDQLLLLLALVSLLIGAVGIANSTLVSVLERTPEIGLRRSVGARRGHVAAQFLTESTTLGLLGGLLGTAAAVSVVLVVAVTNRWTAVLPSWTVFAGPIIGGLIGLLAGLYPAWRAAGIEPVQALRR
ncbi:ABC transporter permease [Micromonospora vinacea]|uniref:ABC transporter permease n=1 Tax=Micromonospora vinacea TaxID=709878 RepID=UPI00344FCF96